MDDIKENEMKELQKDRINLKKEEVKFVTKEQLEAMGIRLFDDENDTKES